MERKDDLQGLDIEEDSIRVYDEAEAFAPIIGYTGKADADELKELKEQGHKYSADAVIGKAGIEKIMETQLRGTDGSDKVLVDTMGKALETVNNSRKNPKSGNNIYLTLDKDLQRIAYNVLEQKIAGILVSNIINAKEFRVEEGMDTAIKTPIYDVYNALIEKQCIDISHFKEEMPQSWKNCIRRIPTAGKVFQQIKKSLPRKSLWHIKTSPKKCRNIKAILSMNF